MKGRPILFNGEMVRALLDGRKTQTRRVMKPQPRFVGGRGDKNDPDAWETIWARDRDDEQGYTVKEINDRFKHVCPYGQPGDRLWVRETFCPDWCDHPIYRADVKDGSAIAAGYNSEPVWTPSIHMPRWASRITLEITDIRIERLQEISEEDAKAEGLGRTQYDFNRVRARDQFAVLWDQIYAPNYCAGPRCVPWDSNPWVWVIKFRRLP